MTTDGNTITCEMCPSSLDLQDIEYELPDGWIHLGNDVMLLEQEGCYFCSIQCLSQWAKEKDYSLTIDISEILQNTEEVV